MKERIIKSLLCVGITMFSLSSFAYASGYVINTDFEDSSIDSWYDKVSRGSAAIESESDGNHYMAINLNEGETGYFNFTHEAIPQMSGIIHFECDIKFNAKNTEIQIGKLTNESGSKFDIAGRARKKYYYIEQFSQGAASNMFVPDSESWYELHNENIWYKLKMTLDTELHTYSIQVFERNSKNLVAEAANIPMNADCDAIDYLGISSYDKLCIDNVKLFETEAVDAVITGERYKKTTKYPYRICMVCDGGEITAPVKGYNWRIIGGNTNAVINENSGFITNKGTIKFGHAFIAAQLSSEEGAKTAVYYIEIE